MEIFLIIIVIALIVLFFISFAFFVSRLWINTYKQTKPNRMEEKLDTIIEQNNRIISLLEEKR